VGREDFKALADWLLERALEHDKPTLLYELICEKLRSDQLLRPGVTRLERLVAEARERAQTETFRQLTPLLTDDCQRFLDTLLEPDPARGLTPLTWLRRPAISNSPRAILGNLEKLAFLRAAGVEDGSEYEWNRYGKLSITVPLLHTGRRPMQALIMVPLQEEMALLRQACTAHGLATADATVGQLVAMRVPALGLTVAPGGLGKVQFAIQTQHVLEVRRTWDVVIGAGAFVDTLAVGDVVVGM
jgi:hypothetical protein